MRGAAPGTRETDLLRPGTLIERVHAIFLTGGSAFGLNVAEGIMRYLEVEGIGFPTPAGVVPIVPGAVIYDLPMGIRDRRPTRDFGLDAARGKPQKRRLNPAASAREPARPLQRRSARIIPSRAAWARLPGCCLTVTESGQ